VPIDNRDLAAGTKISARYKGKTHTCEVVQTDEGIAYRLDGKDYNSPSSAGRAVTGGVAVNGWRFWSLDGDLKPARAKTEPKSKTTKRAPAKKKPAKKAAAKKGKPARAASKGDQYGCGVCGESFTTLKAATKHAGEAHIS
jgi:hypothetical protein